jgi:probable rRNA maturation factor
MEQRARAILNALDCPDGELSLLIVDDAGIAALNREYLNREGPTNVIAFPMREGKFSEISPQLLGDVVVSVDTARREAEIAGGEWEERFVQLMVHGILHLFGYDHEQTEKEARRMEAKSHTILNLIKGI